VLVVGGERGVGRKEKRGFGESNRGRNRKKEQGPPRFIIDIPEVSTLPIRTGNIGGDV